MEEIDLAAMLAAKRSAGVASEVNLREWVTCVPRQVQIRLPTLALKPRGDITRSPKQGYQWPHEKDLCPPKFFFQKSQTSDHMNGTDHNSTNSADIF